MTIKRLLRIFTFQEKLKFSKLFLAILVAVFLEIIGVASILPFMELVAHPDAIDNSEWLQRAYDFFGFTSHRELLVATGLVIIILIGITNAFLILTTWMQYKYSWETAHNFGTRLLRTYLHKPYAFYLMKNTTQLQAYIIGEVGNLTGGVIIPGIELVSRSLVSIVIFILLLIIDPQIALIMFCSLGGAYLLIYLARQNFLKRIGRHRINMNMLRYRTLGELLGGMKTVKVYNEQGFFYDRYEEASREFCNVQPKYNLVLVSPRYVLEFLAFGTILIITIYLYISSGNIQAALPKLSFYAVAGYRLLPALQKTFAAAAKIRHNFPVLDRLYDDLYAGRLIKSHPQPTVSPMPFHRTITLQGVHYNYDNTDQAVINDISLEIQKGQTVAFVGATGSGKTTLIDLIVGLLSPTEGAISIDDTTLHAGNIANWQANVAYVPQEVFLFDDSVRRNIAIGREDAEIDRQLLLQVAQVADIADFIENELKAGFESEIGEKGVRLSGGQRQRLGLARALYRRPAVLVLDEATSALDSITEKGIIESLKSFSDDLTTIIIAHRLSTVRHADAIYIMSEGNIVAKGTYQSLMQSNDTFKNMVQLS